MNGASALLILRAIGGISALVAAERKMKLYNTVLSGLLLGVFQFWGPDLIPSCLFPLALSTQSLDLCGYILYNLILYALQQLALQQPVQRSCAWNLSYQIFCAVYPCSDGTIRNLELPEGYRAEVVAKGFTFPTTLLIDENENVYVAEAGYAYGPKTTLARVLKVRKNGSVEEIARDFEGPINGLAIKGNMLYISHRGKITELDLESKERKDLVKDLPSLGDHQNNDLIFGEDALLWAG